MEKISLKQKQLLSCKSFFYLFFIIIQFSGTCGKDNKKNQARYMAKKFEDQGFEKEEEKVTVQVEGLGEVEITPEEAEITINAFEKLEEEAKKEFIEAAKNKDMDSLDTKIESQDSETLDSQTDDEDSLMPKTEELNQSRHISSIPKYDKDMSWRSYLFSKSSDYIYNLLKTKQLPFFTPSHDQSSLNFSDESSNKLQDTSGSATSTKSVENVAFDNNTAIVVMHGMGSSAEAIKSLPYLIKGSISSKKISHENIFFICRDKKKIYEFQDDQNQKLTPSRYSLAVNYKNGTGINNQSKGLEHFLRLLIKSKKYNRIVILSHSISGTITLNGLNNFVNRDIKDNKHNIKFSLIFVNAALSGLYLARDLPTCALYQHGLLCKEFKDLVSKENQQITTDNRKYINNIRKKVKQQNLHITVISSRCDFLSAIQGISKCSLAGPITLSKMGFRYYWESNESVNEKTQNKANSAIEKHRNYSDGTLNPWNCFGGRFKQKKTRKIIYNSKQTDLLPDFMKNDNIVKEENIFDSIDDRYINFCLYDDLGHTNFKKKMGYSLIKFLNSLDRVLSLSHHLKKVEVPSILESQNVASDIIKYGFRDVVENTIEVK